jgi:iron(II)-dependent oxidoreductase
LLAPFDDDFLCAQHSPLMSPLVWDLAHIANYEELWLVRSLGGDALRPDLDDLYDAFRHPRPDRPALPLLDPPAARAYASDVRNRTLDVLDRAAFDDGEPLLDRGFVYGMVIQHEHQHDETMLATLQLSGSPVDLARSGPAAVCGMKRVADRPFSSHKRTTIGTSDDAWAYDNERPAHDVEVQPCEIDRTPVGTRDVIAFIADGGYRDERLWTDEGWKWRANENIDAPQFWQHEGGDEWSVLRFGTRQPVALDEPVQHVCWYEADAFARWAGKRLPTEIEWEAAHRAGALDGVGEVWEWTASSFSAWPGFRSFPYREYSEVFFGDDYKVLRGSSWASDDSVRRPTFRNWDYPIRRQIFAGIRCAAH